MINVTVLAENYVKDFRCRGEFGLAMYIETEDHKILFDTGASELMFANARQKGVDLSEADICVISHGHFDHTGGMPEFCRQNRKADIYLHRDAFGATFGETKGKIDDYECGILWDPEVLEVCGDRVIRTDGPEWIGRDVVVSGTIPELPEFQPPERFYRLRTGADPGLAGELTPESAGEMSAGSAGKSRTGRELIPDTMSHEQFLAIREPGKGIVLFSGCSHKGIIAAICRAKALFPGEPLYAVVAGMHLIGASCGMRQKIIDRLTEEEPQIVVPLHCTGLEAICMMKAQFGDRCRLTGTGGRLRF